MSKIALSICARSAPPFVSVELRRHHLQGLRGIHKGLVAAQCQENHLADFASNGGALVDLPVPFNFFRQNTSRGSTVGPVRGVKFCRAYSTCLGVRRLGISMSMEGKRGIREAAA